MGATNQFGLTDRQYDAGVWCWQDEWQESSSQCWQALAENPVFKSNPIRSISDILCPVAGAGLNRKTSKTDAPSVPKLIVPPKLFPGGEESSVWLNPRVEHAGSGRRILSSNVTTFLRRRSLRDPAPCRQGTLRTLRLQVQTCQRRASISDSIRQGPRAQQNKNL